MHCSAADEAIQRAGFGADTAGAGSCGTHRQRADRRFYPLWQLQNAGRTVWVDSVRGTGLADAG